MNFERNDIEKYTYVTYKITTPSSNNKYSITKKKKKLVSNTGIYKVVLLEWKRQYEDKIEKSD